MGVINFGVNNNSGEIFSRIKSYPTPNMLRAMGTTDIPVVRSGAVTYFQVTNNTTVLLKNSSSGATIATITSVASLASSTFINYHLSSVDACLYCLLYDGTGNALVIKISDTTGTVTVLGSSFAVATPAKWAVTPELSFIERVGDNLKIISSGVYHEVSTTTGALLSQDTVISTDGYVITPTYISASNNIYASGVIRFMDKGSLTYQEGHMNAPTLAKSGIGVVSGLNLPISAPFGSGTGIGIYFSSTTNVFPIISIDNDKICFLNYSGQTGTLPVKVALRSSYDSFLQSVINYAAGV